MTHGLLLFCYIADILTKVLEKYSLSSPQPNIGSLFKQLNWNGCHGNKKWRKKKYKKMIFSEAIRMMNLILYRNVRNISLYKNSVLHCHG